MEKAEVVAEGSDYAVCYGLDGPEPPVVKWWRIGGNRLHWEEKVVILKRCSGRWYVSIMDFVDQECG
jgi:hypothetical protein